ncbi:arginine/serine-rich protein 1 isoform X2 [Scleropages formosus]|uniref:arginine/serine-rich protein 1 isoform X2 n=1 Tax=Scleropages formosus TaxID=113540 RepID=UPI000877F61F|nr:arginine/serine-rich protein 1 isoform X2 [Scleropages formosus]
MAPKEVHDSLKITIPVSLQVRWPQALWVCGQDQVHLLYLWERQKPGEITHWCQHPPELRWYDQQRKMLNGTVNCHSSAAESTKEQMFIACFFVRIDKRELLKIAQANAAKALGVETLELPASVKSILGEPVESSHLQRFNSEGSVLRRQIEQNKVREVEEDVPSPKTSPKNKVITFSIHNSVAKPTTSKASHGPESPASTSEDSVTGGSPYGQWVPIKAQSFPLPAHKQSPYKTR